MARGQADINESTGKVEKANLNLAKTRVVAPFNGRIIRTTVSEGERVVAGLPPLQITGSDDLEIRAALPLSEGTLLRKYLASGGSIITASEIDGERLGFRLEHLASILKYGQIGVDVFLN